MTGSMHADVDAVVMTWNSGKHDDAVAAVKGDALLAQHVQDEITRIETPGHRNLLDPRNGDVVSQKTYATLKAIQAAVAA